METVCFIGLGYVGLPTAAVLATTGMHVIGVDNNPQVVASLQRGEVHIEEPGLQTVVSAALLSKKLRVVSTPEPADAFFIAVPTPILADKRADLSYVRAAVESILPVLRRGNLVVLESTSPAGTTRGLLCDVLSRAGFAPGEDLSVAYCPERILPGRVLQELVSNARVIGGIDRKSAERARAIYQRFVDGPLHLTDATTAELVKLFENTSRDINIAMANEFAKIAEAAGSSAHEVIRMANLHPRVNILEPGPGVGGHCIPVDPWFLVESFPTLSPLIATARRINDSMADHVIAGLQNAGVQPSSKVAILGAAYKADIDDARESPSEHLAEKLIALGYNVSVHDPLVKRFAYPLSSLEEALHQSEAAVLAVHHSGYRALAPDFFRKLMRRAFVYDTRNVLPVQTFAEKGVEVVVLGDGRKEQA